MSERTGGNSELATDEHGWEEGKSGGLGRVEDFKGLVGLFLSDPRLPALIRGPSSSSRVGYVARTHLRLLFDRGGVSSKT